MRVPLLCLISHCEVMSTRAVWNTPCNKLKEEKEKNRYKKHKGFEMSNRATYVVTQDHATIVLIKLISPIKLSGGGTATLVEHNKNHHKPIEAFTLSWVSSFHPMNNAMRNEICQILNHFIKSSSMSIVCKPLRRERIK
uniref:Secreted protein n=1 Tax=Glossina pallidipes TaxID=7398 RepID=A0A1B0A9M4_GLOPL